MKRRYMIISTMTFTVGLLLLTGCSPNDSSDPVPSTSSDPVSDNKPMQQQATALNPVFHSLKDKSDLVVLGKVIGKQSRWVDKKIITTAQVSVLETLKGKKRKSIEIDYLGGSVGFITQDFSHEATLDIGEVSVLFLKNPKLVKPGSDAKAKTTMNIISESARVRLLRPRDRPSRLKNSLKIQKFLKELRNSL